MKENWEYKEEIILSENLMKRINQLGKEGWEVYDQQKLNEDKTNENYKVFLKRIRNGPQLLKS